MRLAVTPDVVAALVLRERDADPVDFRLYTGPPSGPLQLRSRTRFETERIWIPVDLAADADRVLLGEPRFAYRVNVLAPGGPQQPVTWGGSLVGPVALSGERVAFLGTTRTDEDASYDHLYVIDRRSGGVEASAELRHDEDADFDDLDLAPDGRAVAALDGNLLTVAPGVAPARRTGRFSVPRFSGDGFAVLQEQRRFRARAPVLLEPNGAERILGTPSTAIGAFEADDRGAAWLANGCVLYAPRDGAPPTVSTPLAPSTPAGKQLLDLAIVAYCVDVNPQNVPDSSRDPGGRPLPNQSVSRPQTSCWGRLPREAFASTTGRIACPVPRPGGSSFGPCLRVKVSLPRRATTSTNSVSVSVFHP